MRALHLDAAHECRRVCRQRQGRKVVRPAGLELLYKVLYYLQGRTMPAIARWRRVSAAYG